MKKIIMVLIIVLSLTGCKKTYLTCTKVVTDNESVEVDETIKLTYKRKELSTSTIYTDYLFKSNAESNKESLRDELNNECEKYEDIKGVSCSVYEIENKLRFELTVSVNKISDEDKSEFEEMLDYGTYTETFKSLEKEYTCK